MGMGGPMKIGGAGFTLIELMIVVLIIGILAAVGFPMYTAYVVDAKLAEGKALAGSALTALQACAQLKGRTGMCTLDEATDRIGVTATGATGDGRWLVDPSSSLQLTEDRTYTGYVWVQGAAAGDNDTMSVAIFGTAAGLVVRCNRESSALPAQAGPPC